MEMKLNKETLEEVLRLYYSELSNTECKVVVGTSVEYSEGRYNEVDEYYVVCAKITSTVEFCKGKINIPKIIKRKEIERVLNILAKDQLPSVDYFEYKISGREFEEVTIHSYKKEDKLEKVNKINRNNK